MTKKDQTLVDALRENTEALRALTEALKPQGIAAQTPGPRFDKPATAAEAPSRLDGQHTKPAPAKVEAPKAPLDYDKDVKPLALALIKKDVAKMKAILVDFGVAKATELAAGDLAEFVIAVKGALDE